MNKRFNPEKLDKLNNPLRLKEIPPDYIWRKLSSDKIETMVDIGAGTGFFSIPFLKLAGKGKVYACDISSVMISWMEANITNHYPDIIPILINDERIPLKDSLADLVFMITLHHELDDHGKILRECKRLLKAGGKILIIDWKKGAGPFGPPESSRYETAEVAKQLEQAGFKGISVDESLSKHFVVLAEK
ncbi:MAG: class I SAM-dependent methyltransferase [Spirochaetales bacterium]|nr:class I SAM-dependent methyltransferase [Spirochaetales bacterium]